uniref:Uncharacterized protein n=2 Tax=Bursaphelenchus xylophilus TaxID=6326 RepID=A0A1I7S5Z2_BURXY
MDSQILEDFKVSSTRQRLESCIQDIQQLDALRLKHKLLIEQLRRDYPSMRSFMQSLEDSDDSQTHSPRSQDSGSQQTSGSSDSGFGHNRDQSMTYSNFRKLSLEERKDRKNVLNSGHLVENTLKNLTTQFNPVLPTTSWTMRSKGPLDTANRPHSCYGKMEQENGNGRPSSLIVTSKRGSRILDSFAQLTPPPVTRKFATVQPPIRADGPPKVMVRPTPEKRESILQVKPQTLLNNRSLQKAELCSPTVSKPPCPPTLTPSTNSAFTARSLNNLISNNLSTRTANNNTPCLQKGIKKTSSFEIPTVTPFNWKNCSMVEEVPRKPSMEVYGPSTTLPTQNSKISNFTSNRPSGNNNVSQFENRWKKNVASVPPTIQKCEPNPPAISRMTPLPKIENATLTKAHSNTGKFTSSCSIAISVPSKNPNRPVIRVRRPKEWHESDL